MRGARLLVGAAVLGAAACAPTSATVGLSGTVPLGDAAVVSAYPPPPLVYEPIPPAPSAAYVWVDGFWGWSAPRTRYVWTPGRYHQAPRGYAFSRGYWVRDHARWRRVPGRWVAGGGRRARRY